MARLRAFVVLVVTVAVLAGPVSVSHAVAKPPDCNSANHGQYWNDPETGIGYWCDAGSRQFKDVWGRPHPYYMQSTQTPPGDCSYATDGKEWKDTDTGITYYCDAATGKYRDEYGRAHPSYAEAPAPPEPPPEEDYGHCSAPGDGDVQLMPVSASSALAQLPPVVVAAFDLQPATSSGSFFVNCGYPHGHGRGLDNFPDRPHFPDPRSRT
jgi:hypothetical protein